MLEQIAVAAVGEDTDARQFFGLFSEEENAGFFLDEVCAFLNWNEAAATRILRGLERQELVWTRNGLVQLTVLGKRVLSQLITR